jgi:polysaccharide export outer membrane protein
VIATLREVQSPGFRLAGIRGLNYWEGRGNQIKPSNSRTQPIHVMTTSFKNRKANRNSSDGTRRCVRPRWFLAGIALAVGFSMAATGCQAPAPAATDAQLRAMQEANKAPDVQTIREGDVLKIAFPGAPNLDTTQQVRRDGRINLSIIGEVLVAGVKPADLAKQLAQQYASQLVEKEVNVTVVSSSFSVFVTGAVIRPGKITSDHPITVLEAVMEAGGFDNAKADIKAVLVIRIEDGQTRNITLNMKDVLEGRETRPFYLKPSDSVIVPERFSWF